MKLLKCFMQRKSIFTTSQGTDIGRFRNWKRPARPPCSEEVVVPPEVSLGKGKSRSHRQRDGFSFYLGETDIPEIIVKDKVLKLDLHMILKGQVSFQIKTHFSIFMPGKTLGHSVYTVLLRF